MVASGQQLPSPPAGREHGDDAALRRRVAAAWATLLDESDAIADGIVLSLLAADRDTYQSAGPELRAELRASTREHVRRGIRTMAGLATDDDKAVHVWRETGRRRARQGVPMEHVLNAYSLGTRVLWEALVARRDRPGIDLDDHVLLVAGQQIWSALDVQNATLVDAYRRESARLQQRDLHRQQRLLDGLVEGRGADPDFVTEVRDAFGLNTDDPVACVVARLDDVTEGPLRGPEDELERAGVLSFWHVRSGAHFALVSSGRRSTAEIVDLLGASIGGRAGIAPAPEGVSGFAGAYQLAVRAADTVPRGAQGVVSVLDRLPEVLLGGNPEVTTLLVNETVAPLLNDSRNQSGVLISTLEALLSCDGSPTHAAERLFCHRNSVIYRMKQIETLTGRSLQSPRDKLLLTLGLMAVGRLTSG